MKSLQKRLEQIEEKMKPESEYPSAYVAIVNEDGSVNVSHAKEDDFTLPSEEALNAWIDDNGLDKTDFIRVILVNSKGKHPDIEPPKEL